jgi:hypothetical protein
VKASAREGWPQSGFNPRMKELNERNLKESALEKSGLNESALDESP